MDVDKLAKSATTDGKPPAPGLETAGAPQPIGRDGQHGAYWVLSEEERKKGFVRPVRRSYVHTGARPKHPLRSLTTEEQVRFTTEGYVKYEAYPESESPIAGRYWTEKQLSSGCGGQTTMGLAIAETYARDPKYYGSTFCCGCRKHLPVSEFTWDGTTETVGS
jgi:hypothetical protein